MAGFFSALQIRLIIDKTFSTEPFWFALGDDFFVGIQFLVHFLLFLIILVKHVKSEPLLTNSISMMFMYDMFIQ